MKKETPQLREIQETILLERILIASPATSIPKKASIFHSGEKGLNLGVVMNSLGNYIESAFQLDDNPLRHLRKHFPRIYWQYHGEDELIKMRDQGTFGGIISSADYVWSSTPHFWWSGVVTAVGQFRHSSGKDPYHICHWATSLHRNNSFGWSLSDIHKGAGKLIRYNNCVDGTQLFATDGDGKLVELSI